MTDSEITINVNSQRDGYIFGLRPRSRVWLEKHYPDHERVSSVFIGVEHVTDLRLIPETILRHTVNLVTGLGLVKVQLRVFQLRTLAQRRNSATRIDGVARQNNPGIEKTFRDYFESPIDSRCVFAAKLRICIFTSPYHWMNSTPLVGFVSTILAMAKKYRIALWIMFRRVLQLHSFS